MKIKISSTVRLNILIGTILVLFAVTLPCEVAGARQIIYPPDNAILDEADVEVLGISAGEGSTLAWGAQEGREEVALSPGNFAAAITLLPGKNSISIG